ncbi:MAG: VOC family protein [Cyclobacteriaceae bacterium]
MRINQVKENCLYVKNLQESRRFYHEQLGMPIISFVENRHVFFRAGSSVLLCFLPEVTKEEKNLPPHYAHGPQHLAFEVPRHEYELWKEKLKKQQVKITHEQEWKEGKKSFYFEDPSGNVLEILPPGVWE